MKIKSKILLSAIMPILVIFAMVDTFTIYYSLKQSKATAETTIEAISKEYSNAVDATLEAPMSTGRTLAHIFEKYKITPVSDRRDIFINSLKSVIENNASFTRIWSIWEPNALDGKDDEYAGRIGHDYTGRFNTRFYRDGSKVNYEKYPDTNYLTEQKGNYYTIPLISGEESIIEPHTININKKDTSVVTFSFPIKDGDKVIGVVGIDFDINNFQALIEKKVIYKTGFGRLITADKTVIFQTNDDTAVGTKWDLSDDPEYEKSVADKIESGKIHTAQKFSKILKRVITECFVPIHIGRVKTPWIFGIVVPTKEIFEISNGVRIITLVFSILGISIFIGIAIFAVKRVINPLSNINELMKDIASGEGDLTKRLDASTKDEIGQLSKHFNDFIEKLLNIVIDLKNINKKGREIGENLAASSEETSSTIVEISATVKSMDERLDSLKKQIDKTAVASNKITGLIEKVNNFVDTQSVSVSQSSTAIEQMIVSIQSLESTTERKKKSADQLVSIAKDGEESMKQTVSSIEEISRAAETIIELVGVINNVADQTGLLAMNAAIEAAHAGESGKGFSVVADEIRKLAESTTENARDISTTITNVVNGIKGTAEVTNDTGMKMGSIINGIEELSMSMNEMLQNMKELNIGSIQITEGLTVLKESSENVKQRSNEVSMSIKEIDAYISEISDYAGENHNGMSEIATGMTDIANAAVMMSQLGTDNASNIEILDNTINKFKI